MWRWCATRRSGGRRGIRSNPVIASQRVGAKRRPMTGSAKQSITRAPRQMDCFVAYAPRNEVVTFRFKFQTADTRPHSRGTICPSFAFRFPSTRREQGMPDARCTRGLVCKMHERKRTRAYRFSGGYPTFPAQWFYGLCRALPGERIRLVTVAAGLIADRPGRIDFATGSLAPATGVGTTRFCRTQQRRSSSRCDPLTDQGSALLSLCAPTLPRPPHPTRVS